MDTNKEKPQHDNEKETDNQLFPIDKVQILVTEEDKTGDNLLAMSDFFSGYVNQMSNVLLQKSESEIIPHIPFSDLGIVSEVIRKAEVSFQGNSQLIPDFDHLPKDIRQKLEDGIYKIGDSRQVEGNLRAVIVDETGTRVKDVTLKEVKLNPETMDLSRSIANQLQMRQIYAKIDDIQEMQSFQIDRDRDRDMKVPFLEARYYILKAQSDNCPDTERKACLDKAAEKLLSAVNSGYTEISTAAEHLEKLTNFPIFQRKKQIKQYIGFITEDIQSVTKIAGLRMQVLDYLGDKNGSRIEMERYKRVMKDFFSKPIGRSSYSIVELIHMSYPYNDENRNCWYDLSVDIKPKLESLSNQEENRVFLVSVEDVDNEK